MAQGKLDAVGLIVSDLARSVQFYRLIGAPFADGAEESEHGHAEAQLANGFRLLLDTEVGVQSFDPDWKPLAGEPRASLAFRCGSPAEVDELYTVAVRAGARGH